jgi:hypothetical protein
MLLDLGFRVQGSRFTIPAAVVPPPLCAAHPAPPLPLRAIPAHAPEGVRFRAWG